MICSQAREGIAKSFSLNWKADMTMQDYLRFQGKMIRFMENPTQRY